MSFELDEIAVGGPTDDACVPEGMFKGVKVLLKERGNGWIFASLNLKLFV